MAPGLKITTFKICGQDFWHLAVQKNGKDESNLIYIDLLSRITPSEAYIINYLGKKCSESKGLVSKYFHTLININNELFNESLYFENLDYLECFDHLERELNHLESLGLIRDVELVYQHNLVGMAATGLLLDLYVRCNGSLLSTNNYFAQFWESNLNKFNRLLLSVKKFFHLAIFLS